MRTCLAAIQTKDNELLQNYLLAGRFFFMTKSNVNERYFSSGFPVDQADPTNQSRALHVAVESANTSAIELLLKNGAQVDVLDCTQSTPLHLAASLASESVRSTEMFSFVRCQFVLRLFICFCHTVLM